MTEFRRYSPALWHDDGVLVRIEREPFGEPMSRPEPNQAFLISLTLSVLLMGSAAMTGWYGSHGDSQTHPPPSSTSLAEREENQREIARLASELSDATRFISSTTARRQHPLTLELVQYGWAAVPHLISLLDTPGDWDIVLSEITGENPVPEGERGRRQAAISAWREWARVRGLTDVDARRDSTTT